MDITETFKKRVIQGVDVIVWKHLSKDASPKEAKDRKKLKDQVGMANIDMPMLDMRKDNGNLVFNNITMMADDIDNWIYAFNQFYDPEFISVSEVNGGMKLQIKREGKLFITTTFYPNTGNCMIQAANLDEEILLQALKVLPEIKKIKDAKQLLTETAVVDELNNTEITVNEPIISGDGRKESQDEDEGGDVTIIDPVLCYIVYGVNSGTHASVKKAVLGHFTAAAISKAKDILFEKCDNTVIGKKQRRNSTMVRTNTEANLADIMDAITLLDNKGKLPNLAILANDLKDIPRSHPEELNNISLVDRLNKLEDTIQALKDITERSLQENVELREELKQIRTQTTVPAMSSSPVSTKLKPAISPKPKSLPSTQSYLVALTNSAKAAEGGKQVSESSRTPNPIPKPTATIDAPNTTNPIKDKHSPVSTASTEPSVSAPSDLAKRPNNSPSPDLQQT